MHVQQYLHKCNTLNTIIINGGIDIYSPIFLITRLTMEPTLQIIMCDQGSIYKVTINLAHSNKATPKFQQLKLNPPEDGVNKKYLEEKNILLNGLTKNCVLLLSPSQYQAKEKNNKKHSNASRFFNIKKMISRFGLTAFKNNLEFLASDTVNSLHYIASLASLGTVITWLNKKHWNFYAVDCYDYGLLYFMKKTQQLTKRMLIVRQWDEVIYCLLVIDGIPMKAESTSVYGAYDAKQSADETLADKLLYYFHDVAQEELQVMVLGNIPLAASKLPEKWQTTTINTQGFMENIDANKHDMDLAIWLPLIGCGLYHAKD
jgi:hypothetical protein